MGCLPWLLVCSLLAWTNAYTVEELLTDTVDMVENIAEAVPNDITNVKHKLYKHRYRTLRNNMKKVYEIQALEQGSTVYGATRLADLTEEEFKTNYQDIPYIPLPGSFVWRVQADGSWKFKCQHGDKDCLRNILEVCIMQQLNWDSDMYLPVISCMEGSDDPVSSAKGCVRDLSSLSYDAVKDCSAGKEGNKLEHSMGVKTESLDPPHKYVPWVVVNGEHTDELQEKAQSAV